MEKIIKVNYKLNKNELNSLVNQKKALGYSYKNLAEKTNLSIGYIQYLFSGERLFDQNKIEIFERIGFVFEYDAINRNS